MKITILFGSPRKQGNTSQLLAPVMKVFQDNSVELKFYNVYDCHISGCLACRQCQKDMDRPACIIQDDFQPILEDISSSDLILLAAPVYCWSLPAPLKAVVDRLVYSTCRYYGEDPHGPAFLKGKKLALVTTCGYPLEKGSDLLEEAMKRYCRHCQLTYAGALVERHKSYNESFMNAEKETRAIAFANSLLGK